MRTFELDGNKMSFTGKSDKEINRVLDMFGGEWEETTKPRSGAFECENCGHRIEMSKEDLDDVTVSCNEMLIPLLDHSPKTIKSSGILTTLDYISDCCKYPDYRRKYR